MLHYSPVQLQALKQEENISVNTATASLSTFINNSALLCHGHLISLQFTCPTTSFETRRKYLSTVYLMKIILVHEVKKCRLPVVIQSVSHQ